MKYAWLIACSLSLSTIAAADPAKGDTRYGRQELHVAGDVSSRYKKKKRVRERTGTGSVAVFTALKEYDATAEMFVRLKVASNKITEIETFVVRAGDQRWFAPQNLENLSDLFAQAVPAAERHTRDQLVAAANSYFDAVQTEGTPQFKQAPFAPGMKRFENGLQTTNVTSNPIMERHTWSPDLQLERASYKGTLVMDRRFPIVDLEHGTVLGVGTFRREGPDTSTLLLAEMFKVTGGKLREIRAVILNLPNGAGTGWSAQR